jgi:protein ImuB
VLAIVLPELLCELAKEPLLLARKEEGRVKNRRNEAPLGVVLGEKMGEEEAAPADSPDRPGSSEASGSKSASAKLVRATAVLDAVNAAARRYGVERGQTIAEACALVSHLTVREVSEKTILTALGRIAELAFGFGSIVSVKSPDTVWVDITGVAHLMGGEEALAGELLSRVRALGHTARAAVGNGPILSRAFASWLGVGRRARGEQGVVVAPSVLMREKAAELPVSALPLEDAVRAWLIKLGVLTWGELAALPRAATAARLGKDASRLLDLCEGKDPEPLASYVPPRQLTEESSWDDPVDGLEPLRFVLGGLTARLAVRLEGRGEAAQRLKLRIFHDRISARFHGCSEELVQEFELCAPLFKEQELKRVIMSRLERLTLEAPTVAMRLEATGIVPAIAEQLELARVSSGMLASCPGQATLPVLLAELSADLGKQRIGVLKCVNQHRPEAMSRLVSAVREVRVKGKARRSKDRAGNALSFPQTGSFSETGAPEADQPSVTAPEISRPCRLLPKPVPLPGAFRVGATQRIGHRLFSVESVRFEHRLEEVEWWSGSKLSRDYLKLLLKSSQGVTEAAVFVERESGARFLHGIWD